MCKRISQKQLEGLERQISDRDKAVLRSIQKCRYLTTGQIQRLHFTDAATQAAALRAASRAMSKLKDYGLVVALDRRIGGVRAGSGSFVWDLEAAGLRLLQFMDKDKNAQPRKRLFEPSPRFLEHTLAVSECWLQLRELCATSGAELLAAEFEPECWRKYKDETHKPAVLKPDMFAVTANGEYEDNWFFEIDLATEAPVKILGKCRRYIVYFKSGVEQRKYGVFPYVAWIVPSLSRKTSVRQHINEAFPRGPDIFAVLTPDELKQLISQGADAFIAKAAKKDEKM